MNWFAEHGANLGWGVASGIIVFAILWTLRRVLLAILHRVVARTADELDDQLLGALKRPTRIFMLAVSIVAFVGGYGKITNGAAERSLALILLSVILAALTMAASRSVIILLAYYLRRSGSSQQVTTLTKILIRLVISTPAILILTRSLDWSLAPALTALGAGGLVIGLAFKDTVANAFSGLYVSLSGTLHRGDYIKIDGGHEGRVEDIQWRVTTIRTGQNNTVLIPNAKLAEAVVTNFSYPEKRMALGIPVGVSYSSDVDLVERTLLEAAREASGEVDGLLAIPEPSVRLNPGFGDRALNFTLLVHVTDFERQAAVQDLLRRRILALFRERGIVIPYAAGTVEVGPAEAARAAGIEA